MRQEAYLRQVSPGAAEAIGIGPRSTDDLVAKAEQVRKADPNISRFEAMRRAAKAA